MTSKIIDLLDYARRCEHGDFLLVLSEIRSLKEKKVQKVEELKDDIEVLGCLESDITAHYNVPTQQPVQLSLLDTCSDNRMTN